MPVSHFGKTVLFGSSFIALSTAPVAAQVTGAEAQGAEDSQTLEDIVVTARKREESLMDVPVAVTAIGAVQLERSGVSDLSGISQLAPQVVVGRSDSGAGASFSIRGIGTSFFDSGTEQSVSVNIDGIAAGRGNIITQGYFDLQQVEVLKGPQALFFGKNSPAGVISLTSKSPGDKLEGYVRAGYEFEARERYAEAAVGGPLTDTLKARFAIRGSKMRGWLTNTAVPLDPNPFYGTATPGAAHRSNGGEDLLGRATLMFDPSDTFSATLKVSAGVHKDHGTTGQTICDPAGGLERPTVFGLPDPAGDCAFDKRYQNSAINSAITGEWPLARDGEPYTDTWSTLSSLTMNYDFGNVALTSVTGFFKLKHRQALDFTYSSFGEVFVALGEDTRQWSQELRLVSDFDGPLNFTLGGYWEDGKRTSPTNSMLFLTPDPATGKFHNYENVATVDSQTLSAFGQLRWQFSDQVELAGGVRYSQDKKDVILGNSYVNPSPALVFLRPQGDFLEGKFRDSNWSPEVTLSWKPNDDILVFGAFKTGYKAGGFANPSLLVATQTIDQIRFGSETIKGFEAGFKGELLDRTARIELTAYSYKYSDLQVSLFDQSVFQYKIFNAPSSRIKGVELAGQWRPTRGLSLNAAAAYNSAKYTDFPGFPCYTYQTRATGCTIGGVEDPATGFVAGGQQQLTGRTLSRAPKWAINGGFNYEIDLGIGMSVGLNADVNYTSSYDAGEDKAPILNQKAYTLINAGARLFADAGWEIAFIGRNLTNKYYKYAGSGKSNASPFEYLTYTPRTRELRVQMTYRF